jgi:lambda family phage minor tail protein L
MPYINQEAQKLLPGKRVELFDFDATNLDGATYYRFCSSFRVSGGSVTWKGETYTAIPITATGFEENSKGPLPTPTLRIDNIGLLPAAIINSLGDPLGATVTRWVTFSDFLDDGATPDPNIHFLPHIFVIERKVSQTKISVEFELSAAIDAEGIQLPFRQVLRDVCTHRYRQWNGSSFDYTDATCPYAGSDLMEGGTETPYFEANGDTTTDPAKDVCGKKLSDCKLHFPGQNLPFWGFPGVARIR